MPRPGSSSARLQPVQLRVAAALFEQQLGVRAHLHHLALHSGSRTRRPPRLSPQRAVWLRGGAQGRLPQLCPQAAAPRAPG